MILGFVKSSEMEDLRQAYDNAEIEISRLTRELEEERQKHLELYLSVLGQQNIADAKTQVIESQDALIHNMSRELATTQKRLDLYIQFYGRID
jgi:hypothetical protein